MKSGKSKNNSFSLEGKVVIITGASSGIGKGIALSLINHKPYVVLVARRKKKLLQTAKILEKSNLRVLPIIGDIRDRETREKIISLTLNVFGKIDYLINNAGLGKANLFVEQSDQEIDELIETNLLSLIKLTHLIVPIMKEQKSGHIINMSSSLALLPVFPFAVYCATKAAVKVFSDALREEVKYYGIKVSTVLPGPYNTEFNTVAGISGENILCYQIDNLVKQIINLLYKPRKNLIQPWFFMLLIWFSSRYSFLKMKIISGIADSIYKARKLNKAHSSFEKLNEEEIRIKSINQ